MEAFQETQQRMIEGIMNLLRQQLQVTQALLSGVKIFTS